MATITILPDDPRTSASPFRAMAGNLQATGATVGQALDALGTGGLPLETTLVVVQPMTPDRFFSAGQRDRLAALMAKWRAARDSGRVLEPGEQTELDALVQAEVEAAGRRAAELLGQ